MKPRGLWLILVSLALWAELQAVPTKGTDSAGPSPFPQVGDPGTDRQWELPSKDEGTTLPWVPNKEDAEVLQNNNPRPQEQPGSKEAKAAISGEEGLAGTGTPLPSGETDPGRKKRFLPEGRPGDKTEGATAAQTKPAEKTQVGNLVLEKKPGPGVGIVSGGVELPSPADSLSPAAGKPPPDTGHVAHAESTSDRTPASGGEPRSGGKPASDIELGNPAPGVKPQPHRGAESLEEFDSYDSYDDYDDDDDDDSYDNYNDDDDDDNDDYDNYDDYYDVDDDEGGGDGD